MLVADVFVDQARWEFLVVMHSVDKLSDVKVANSHLWLIDLYISYAADCPTSVLLVGGVLAYLCIICYVGCFNHVFLFSFTVIENWHWNGILIRTQTTRKRQRDGSKSCQRLMKSCQMVRWVYFNFKCSVFIPDMLTLPSVFFLLFIIQVKWFCLRDNSL